MFNFFLIYLFFSFLHILGYFYFSSYKFSDCFLCLLHSKVFCLFVLGFSVIAFFFQFSFWFFCISSTCLLRLFFSFISSVFVNAYWNVFVIATLKELSGNYNICVSNSALAFIDFHFSFKLRSSSLLAWWVVLNWNMDIWDITLWNSSSFIHLLSWLASSNTTLAREEGTWTHYCQVGVRSPGTPLRLC